MLILVLMLVLMLMCAGSLGYGEFLWLGDEPTEHPIDAPAGADATLLLASGSSGAAAAAAAVGASGGEGGRGRGRVAAVEGVHGGDRHLAEDEYARTVQVCNWSRSATLWWQQFLSLLVQSAVTARVATVK